MEWVPHLQILCISLHMFHFTGSWAKARCLQGTAVNDGSSIDLQEYKSITRSGCLHGGETTVKFALHYKANHITSMHSSAFYAEEAIISVLPTEEVPSAQCLPSRIHH
ncbi:hypothetical protein MUK42_35145 [Musa troglodytarum]|uniref:Uncharacterized protein n=1 Tax=Musa troglodytarum TaxID=320322 RepID=A0A9E7E947_9LILI|nr:hypothetical protein MUK42_35145 [Musa troglodytarum]